MVAVKTTKECASRDGKDDQSGPGAQWVVLYKHVVSIPILVGSSEKCVNV
jgi:hypothetical protein